MYLTYVSMGHTLANTAELSVAILIIYQTVTLHLLLLQTEFSAQPAEWQHPYTVDLLQ